MYIRTSFAAVIFACAGIAFAQESATVDDFLKAARTAYAKGNYDASRASLEKAWTTVQDSPPDDPKRYEIVKEQETVSSAAGDYKAAQDYEELAINWRETINGQADPKIADEWIELSNLCQRLKEFPRALLLLQQAMGRHRVLFGYDSIQVADDWSRIALVYQADQKLDQTIQPLLMAIRIRETVLGAEHPAILSELDRLASARITLRYYAEAEETFRRALVIRERLTGRVHADLISTVEGLAYAQFGLKKYDEAEQGYKRLLALWVFSTQQPEHPMIAMTYSKMATFYRAQKRWQEAEEASAKSIALRALFLAYELQHEAAEQLARDKQLEAIRLLQRAFDVLDESRPEHTELRQNLQAALKELVPEAKPTPVKRPSAATTKPAPKKQP